MLQMYDSTDVAALPPNAYAYAGYVNGKWATWHQLVSRFPDAHKLSIAVTAEVDAEALDLEPGDAANAQAANWIRRQHARGVARPVVYTFLANAEALVQELDAAGIKRAQYRLWIAHWTGVPHLCGPACGFRLSTAADATQYANSKYTGKNLDASVVSTKFFVDPTVERHRLRAWILLQRARGVTWAALKRTAQWIRFRRLGGH